MLLLSPYARVGERARGMTYLGTWQIALEREARPRTKTGRRELKLSSPPRACGCRRGMNGGAAA